MSPIPPVIQAIVDSLENKKAVDIRVMDVRELVSYTDFLVLCSGTSGTHVSAIVDNLRDLKATGMVPTYTNPSKDNSWWVLDYVHAVVHVFRDDVRGYYDLERLWSDSTIVAK